MNTLLAIVISGLWCKIDIHVNLRCSNVILHVLRIKSYQQYCDYFLFMSVLVYYIQYILNMGVEIAFQRVMFSCKCLQGATVKSL